MKRFVRALANIPILAAILIFVACNKNPEIFEDLTQEEIEQVTDEIIVDGNMEGAEETLAASSNINSELYEVTLEKVVDGDTLIVANEEGKMKVRLIGIDTPESVHSDESKNTEYGSYASDYVKGLLADTTTLYLQYDEGLTDSYDRVLAYVWLRNGVDVTSLDDVKTYMLNAKIADAGMARVMTIEPNTSYAWVFEELVYAAEVEGRGIYAAASEEDIFK